jgi:hypothetical protein
MGVYSYMNHKEVKPRLDNIFENVRRELSNIEELTDQAEDLDKKWTIWMTERLEEMGKRANKWLKDKLNDAKEAYEDAIKEIKETERIRAAEPRKVLRSAKQKFKDEVEELEAQRKVIDRDVEATKKARTDLQTAEYKAIGSKDNAAIEKATADLKENARKLEALKVKRRHNEWNWNAKVREDEITLLGDEKYGIKHVRAELEEGQKILLGLEKKVMGLKMPVLGSQVTIPIRPGGT